MASDDGVFCSTAGRVFTDKNAFTEHYKSDFHLYNLKRRVAGLPPVTRDWFETRKKQILAATSNKPQEQIWTEPLTKKKFRSEATYNDFIQSKKYQALLKKANKTAAPDPIITEKHPNHDTGPVVREGSNAASSGQSEKEWDVTVSLFDSHKSESFEANLEYMYKRVGFYFPNSDFLTDAQGLLQYLGAKLSDGHIPLYCSGLNRDAKQFGSLKAVQNHMIDVNKCQMLFDDNEEEYEDYYDLDALFDTGAGMELSLGVDPGALSGLEMVVRDSTDGKSKILGNREFWYLYRQRYRPADARDSVMSGQLVEKYRKLGVRTQEVVPDEVKRARRKEATRRSWTRMKTELKSNLTNNLPRNVPY